jgi:HSP20 family protein
MINFDYGFLIINLIKNIMAIIKWEPFDEVDSFFEDFPIQSINKIGLDLAVDLYEENENIIAKMNLPGVNPDKINISVENNMLHVSGAHEEEKEEKKKHYYHKEIKKGSFERVVSLPQVIKNEGVSAEYKHGVLKIILPKTKKEEPAHKIKIEVKK